MPNPTISQITLPSGSTYDIADSVARSQISGAITLRGETTTALTDNATTNPITISGNSYTAIANDAVFYSHKEFVFDGTYWHEFGDMSGLGALATKDSASGTYTPAGSITGGAFTGSSTTFTGNFTPSGTIAVNASSGSGTSYTPEGSVAAPTISLASAGSTTSVTPFGSAGSLPSLSMTVTDGNLTIGFNQGTLPTAGTAVTVKTGDGSYSATAPAFTGTAKKLAFSGTQGSVSVSGTPNGSVSSIGFSGTQATITVS